MQAHPDGSGPHNETKKMCFGCRAPIRPYSFEIPPHFSGTVHVGPEPEKGPEADPKALPKEGCWGQTEESDYMKFSLKFMMRAEDKLEPVKPCHSD